MSEHATAAILPQASPELKRHSDALRALIEAEINANGPMPFSRYMEMALYQPGLGYYSAGLPKFGAAGDFITAPELGSVLARCLAVQVEEVAAQLGPWCLLEVGAGSGRLAADLLNALPQDQQPDCYWILERSASLRQIQLETLQALAPGALERVRWLDRPPEQPWQGVMIANEVMDALPVTVFRLDEGSLTEACVGVQDHHLVWASAAASPALEAQVGHCMGHDPAQWPQRYQSELCPQLGAWLQAVSAGVQRGAVLLLDYGYPREKLYAPQRHMGTLVCHYQHRAHDDPFFLPGLQDITAFVDFTAVAEAADACDLQVDGYSSQAMFLAACGLEQQLNAVHHLPERERQTLLAEVRRLTLPEHMGEKFQVMGLTREMEQPMRGFALQDLRHLL